MCVKSVFTTLLRRRLKQVDFFHFFPPLAKWPPNAYDLAVEKRHHLKLPHPQDIVQPLKIRNFVVSDNPSQGTMIVDGGKIEHLRYPPFPFGSRDVGKMGPTIPTKTEEDICEGGSGASLSLSKLYPQEKEVIKGCVIPFLVMENNGNQTGYFLNMQ